MIWPYQIPKLIILPLNQNNLLNNNKITNLAAIITFLSVNQYNFDKRLLVQAATKIKDKTAQIAQTNQIKHSFHKLMIMADVKNIYNKLKKSEIIKKNRMKVNTQKSLIL